MTKAGTEVVRAERDGPVLLVVIDNPPVNTSTAAVRAGIAAALGSVRPGEGFKAVVIIGAGRHFISGADLREFDGLLPQPQLPAVIAAIEAAPVPVVAALSGAVLGGGFELALGCDARMALAGTQFGLPEVSLGMIPGAGGAQRLPRLVGRARALDLIASSRRFDAAEALACGIVDEVVPGDLRERAVGFAAHRAAGKRRLLAEPLRDNPAAFEQRARHWRAARAAGSAVHEAVDAVGRSGGGDPDEALRLDRAAFDRLRTARPAKALRHVFFAERTAARRAHAIASPQPARVGVVGAGTMGAGIARAFADAGAEVVLVDTNLAAAQGARWRLANRYREQAAQGRLSWAESTVRAARLTAGVIDDLGTCDLIVEAVFETMEAKRAVFTQLASAAREEVVLASNTSYLDLDEIAAACSRPEQVVGLHFFAPAHSSGVVEVITGARSSGKAIATAYSAALLLGRCAVPARVSEGFIGNRVFSAYRRVCELLVLEGASPEQVDAALADFGFAMGPFAVADLSGLDVTWNRRKAQGSTREARARYNPVADWLCERGRLGQKAGAGWYRYEPGSRVPVPDPLVSGLIADAAREQGITRRPIESGVAAELAVAAMANEARLVVAEQVAESGDDIDLLLCRGYGFPAEQGGPLFWFDSLGPQRQAGLLARLEDTVGRDFRVAPADFAIPAERPR